MLKFDTTGERHFQNIGVTSEADHYNQLMHQASYHFALKYIPGKKVLDYGCGSGYGSKLLASVATGVTAVDISSDAVEYARNNYPAENLEFRLLTEITGQKFDVITSFQVIEHIRPVGDFLNEVRKMLNPDGILILTTPDRENRLYSMIQKPWNRFHVTEYSEGSFRKLLNNYFTKVEILKISGTPGFVNHEIARTRKQRLVSLPFTLSVYPEWMRLGLLKFTENTHGWIKTLPTNRNRASHTGGEPESFKSNYTIRDITISTHPVVSTDLLAICHL